MAEFRYTAKQSDGVTASGDVSAASLEAAYADLRRQGLKPISLEPVTAISAPKSRQMPLGALVSWSTRLHTMLQAGIPIDQALTFLSDAQGDKMAPVSNRLLQAVRGGESFADAAQSTGIFPTMVTGLLQASERTSDVAGAMEAITKLLQSRQEMRRTVVQAMVYPAFLLLVAVGSLILMLGFVVPQFEPLLADAPDLPALAGMVLAASGMMQAFATPLLIVLALLIGFGIYAARSPAVGQALGRVSLRLPGLGKIFHDLAIASLFRNLGTFQSADVPVLEALDLAAQAGPPGPHADQLAAARDPVAQGGRLSDSLGQRLFPGDVVDMLKAGEESAAVAPMLISIADMCQTRAKGAIKQMLTLLEPLIILVIGVLIGGVVFSIFQAILSVNDIVI